jgi:hypothetical protein
MYRTLLNNKIPSAFPQLRLIESTIPYGLPSINRYVPIHTRSELIKRLISSGIYNIYTGNLNCNKSLFGTRDLLLDTKDIGYGERTLSASIVTPTKIRSFLSSGADELVIPVDLRFPFFVEEIILFKDEISLARSNGHTVRLQLDGICDSSFEEYLRLIEQCVFIGITHLSILDRDNMYTPSILSLMLHFIKDIVPKDHIALGFCSKNLSNIYTAIEEGITTYHTSLGGIGNYTNTLQLAEFAQKHCIEIPNLHIANLRNTDRWWKKELYN